MREIGVVDFLELVAVLLEHDRAQHLVDIRGAKRRFIGNRCNLSVQPQHWRRARSQVQIRRLVSDQRPQECFDLFERAVPRRVDTWRWHFGWFGTCGFDARSSRRALRYRRWSNGLGGHRLRWSCARLGAVLREALRLDLRDDLSVLGERYLERPVRGRVIEAHRALCIEGVRLASGCDLAHQCENLRARERLFHHWASSVLDSHLGNVTLGEHEPGAVVGYKEVEKAIELGHFSPMDERDRSTND